jgi:hypothetical protein
MNSGIPVAKKRLRLAAYAAAASMSATGYFTNSRAAVIGSDMLDAKRCVVSVAIVGLTWVVSACGSDTSDESDAACADLCGCVTGVLGESAKSECESECREVQALPSANDQKFECQARLDARGAGACKGECEMFALPGPPWTTCGVYGDSDQYCSCTGKAKDDNPCSAELIGGGACCSYPQTELGGSYGCFCSPTENCEPPGTPVTDCRDVPGF